MSDIVELEGFVFSGHELRRLAMALKALKQTGQLGSLLENQAPTPDPPSPPKEDLAPGVGDEPPEASNPEAPAPVPEGGGVA